MAGRVRFRNAPTSWSRSSQILDTSDLEIPVPAPSALTLVSTLRVGDHLKVGLHHHSEEGLVDAAAALQQGWEKRPVPQLGNLQVQVPGGDGQRPGPGESVARLATSPNEP